MGNLLTETDPMGNVTTYGYDLANNLTSMRLPNPTTGSASGGPLTSYTYDGLGEAVTTYDGYAVSPATIGTAAAYAAAGSVTGDLIFEQTETQYDAAGNVTFVTTRDRFTGDSTDTGALTTSDSRASYVGDWYDGIGRQTDTANYGAASPAPTRPDSAPERSDTVLVNSTVYDAAGDVSQTIDPAGNVTTTTYDDAGTPITSGSSTDPTGTVSTYDRQGELIETVNGAGTIHKYAYDEAGRRSPTA